MISFWKQTMKVLISINCIFFDVARFLTLWIDWIWGWLKSGLSN